MRVLLQIVPTPRDLTYWELCKVLQRRRTRNTGELAEDSAAGVVERERVTVRGPQGRGNSGVS